MTEKQKLRKEMREKCEAASILRMAELSARISERILALPAYAAAQTVFCYVGMFGEVETTALIRQMIRDGKTVCLPKVRARGVMDAVRVSSQEDLRPGPYGIPEPSGEDVVPPDSIDLVLVPGLAFDRRGGRLGRGAGFYDRYLAICSGLTVGLAFCFAVTEKLPLEEHDVRVARVVTEREVIAPR